MSPAPNSTRHRLIVGTWIGSCLAAALFGSTAASAAPVGYVFSGLNASTDAQSGSVSGGYYIIDPTIVSQQTAPTEFRWTSQDSSGILRAQFDYMLGDKVDPSQASFNHAWAFNGNVDNTTGSAGYAQYGVFPSTAFNFTTKGGPLTQAGETLGNYLAARSIRDIAGGGGGSMYMFISAPAVSKIVPEHVFRAKDRFGVPLSIQVTTNGATIEATFTPTLNIGGQAFPLKVSDVAKLFGIHHFNWKQTVTAPAGIDVKLDLDGKYETTHDREQGLPPTRVDPIDNSVSRYVYVNPDDRIHPALNQVLIAAPENTQLDTKPYYYNENGGGDWDIASHTTEFSVNFDDTPRLPVTFDSPQLPPTETPAFTMFRTELLPSAW